MRRSMTSLGVNWGIICFRPEYLPLIMATMLIEKIKGGIQYIRNVKLKLNLNLNLNLNLHSKVNPNTKANLNPNLNPNLNTLLLSKIVVVPELVLPEPLLEQLLEVLPLVPKLRLPIIRQTGQIGLPEGHYTIREIFGLIITRLWDTDNVESQNRIRMMPPIFQMLLFTSELLVWRIEVVNREIEKINSLRKIEIVPAGAEEI